MIHIVKEVVSRRNRFWLQICKFYDQVLPHTRGSFKLFSMKECLMGNKAQENQIFTMFHLCASRSILRFEGEELLYFAKYFKPFLVQKCGHFSKQPSFDMQGPGVSNLRPTGCMQARIAVNAAQHKIINLLKTSWDYFLWLCGWMYLMCDPRQLFFQCGAEMPKGWTPLWGMGSKNTF